MIAYERLHREHLRSCVHVGLWRNCKNEDGVWYESPEVIDRKLRYGRNKARLLEWVRGQMRTGLADHERRCLELYHFRGLTYREVGRAVNLHASSAYRAVQRAIRELRRRAEAEGGAAAILKRKRRTPWARYYVSGRRG